MDGVAEAVVLSAGADGASNNVNTAECIGGVDGGPDGKTLHRAVNGSPWSSGRLSARVSQLEDSVSVVGADSDVICVEGAKASAV
jgi:hypothetical protein